jgi:hypothetical protein
MSVPTGDHFASTSASGQQTRRAERVRFSDFAFTRTPSGQCTAEVELEYEGQKVAGRSSGQSSPLADLRVAAEAALRALEQFTDHSLVFELIGVKLIRAFDSNLVIVSVALRGSDAQARLVGCYLVESDTRRGAAVAVLNATNRILGNYISTR